MAYKAVWPRLAFFAYPCLSALLNLSLYLFLQWALSSHFLWDLSCLWLVSVFNIEYNLLSRKSKIILPHILSYLSFWNCAMHTSCVMFRFLCGLPFSHLFLICLSISQKKAGPIPKANIHVFVFELLTGDMLPFVPRLMLSCHCKTQQ